MRRAKGFTLIELMIVIAVIAILSAVAYPAYTDHVRKGRRSDAQQLMLDIMNRQEQYILDKRSYTATVGSGGLGVAKDGWNCTSDATKCTNNYYTVTVALDAGPPPTYTVTATATGTQVADGNLTLTGAGAKTRSTGDGKW